MAELKFKDKTTKEWDDIVDAWHNDTETKLSLQEYMGLNDIEFFRYVHNISDENLSDGEVMEEGAKRARQARVGCILNQLFNM